MAEELPVEYPHTVTESDLESLAETTQLEASPSRMSSIPIAYTGEGEFVFRIWPDRDSNDKLRVLKCVSVHNFRYGSDFESSRIRCARDDRIEKLAKRAKESGYRDAWRWRANDKFYMMVRLYEVPESEYLSPNTDVCLIMNSRQGEAMIKWITNLTRDEMKDVAFPEGVKPAIRMTINGRGRNETVKIDFEEPMPMPGKMMLPDGVAFRSLDEVYIKSTDRVSDEDFNDFRQWAMSVVNQMSDANIVDVTTGNGVESNDEKCYILQLAKTNEEVARMYEGVTFGKRPFAENDYCKICAAEAECRLATEKSGNWDEPNF